jgi:hypothetical protein
MSHRFRVLFRYLWTAPNTALGLLLGIAMLAFAGKGRVTAGVIEFHGGWLGKRLALLPHPFCFGALTLGHVILATCHHELTALRTHEHVHVRQYERWGIFFLPAYALSSVWEVAHGRNGYTGNFFERQAYAVAGREPVNAKA